MGIRRVVKAAKLLYISTYYLCCCDNIFVYKFILNYAVIRLLTTTALSLLEALDDLKSPCAGISHARFPSPSMKDLGLSACSGYGVRRP